MQKKIFELAFFKLLIKVVVQPVVHSFSRYLLHPIWYGATVLPQDASREDYYGLPDTVSPFRMSHKKNSPLYEDDFTRLLEADQLKIQRAMLDRMSHPPLQLEIARKYVLVGQEQYREKILMIYREFKMADKTQKK